MNTLNDKLIIKCPSFGSDGQIPKKHTGFAEDISPEIFIENLSDDAISLAVIMDDLDIPMLKSYNHWIIWNIPPKARIEENIPYGAEQRDGSLQGVGYGKNRYRGPKQPPFIKKAHRYRFFVYALDCMLDMPVTSKKMDLVKAMSGHVLQTGELTGWYKP